METKQQQARLKQDGLSKAEANNFAQERYDKTCASGQAMLNLYTIRVLRRLQVMLVCYSSASLTSFHVCCIQQKWYKCKPAIKYFPASFAIILLATFFSLIVHTDIVIMQMFSGKCDVYCRFAIIFTSAKNTVFLPASMTHFMVCLSPKITFHSTRSKYYMVFNQSWASCFQNVTFYAVND